MERLVLVNILLFLTPWHNSPAWARTALSLRFVDNTQWHTRVCRTPVDKRLARRRDLNLTRHSTHKRQTSMHPAGFEPAIPVGEPSQTLILHRSATGIGKPVGIIWKYDIGRRFKVFYHITSCRVVNITFRRIIVPSSSGSTVRQFYSSWVPWLWRWSLCNPSKFWQLFTSRRGVISQKISICRNTAARTSHIMDDFY